MSGSKTVDSLTSEGPTVFAIGSLAAGFAFCPRRGRMTVLPTGPKGSSFELIADMPLPCGARVRVREAPDFSWPDSAGKYHTGTAAVRSYKKLWRRNMTSAADPQVNQAYPLGELSYVIVVSDVVDWNIMRCADALFFVS